MRCSFDLHQGSTSTFNSAMEAHPVGFSPAISERRGFSVSLAVLLVASSLVVVGGGVVVPALPAIADAFRQVPAATLLVKLVLTLPGIFVAASAPVWGLVIDRWNKQGSLLVALVLFGVSGSSAFFADSLCFILVGRAFLGVAIAGVMTSTTGLIAESQSPVSRAKVLGYQASAMSLGGVVALLAGGLLAEVGWRYPFLTYGVALLLAPVALVSFRGPVGVYSPHVGRSDRLSLRQLGPSALTVCAFAFLGMALLYMVPTHIPFMLRQMMGIGSAGVGLTIGAMRLLSALVATQSARVPIGRRRPTGLALAMSFICGGYLLVYLAVGYWAVLAGLLVAGIGQGLFAPGLNRWAVEIAPPESVGLLIGGLTTFVFVGQFASPLLSEPIVAATSTETAFLVAAALAAGCGLSLGLLVKR